MKAVLLNLARGGDISWLSYYFADFIARQSASDIDDLPALSAALISEHSQAGDVCIDLAAFENKPLFSSSRLDSEDIPRGIDPAKWCAALNASGIAGSAETPAPLLLEDTRLYLYRYWVYEDSVCRWLLERANEPAAPADRVLALAPEQYELDADQLNAVVTAASHRFCVISGGPGSGKTSTVVRILALLLELDPDSRIALAAPTGKAAARMMESISSRLEQIDGAAALLPAEAGTLHRLLGYSGQEFDYHANRRINYDCVIVDEASMIDLKLMHHLLAALPDHARLILLGDRDQLAAVAAGNVLADITGHGQDLSAANAVLASSIALLRHNYRFDQHSAIGELALAVNQGRSDEAMLLLAQEDRGLRWHEVSDDTVDSALLDFIVDRYQSIYDSNTPAAALDAFSELRVLCATNQGSAGVDALNYRISQAMMARNLAGDAELFHGMPIMITRNHRQLGLYNGDSGILWQFDNGLRACFADADDAVRELAINRLPGFVPAWASTVHKSQGSEYANVVLFLPSDPASPALSRELIYTAVTRARRQFVLHGGAAVLIAACTTLTRRHSGLAAKLGWTATDR